MHDLQEKVAQKEKAVHELETGVPSVVSGGLGGRAGILRVFSCLYYSSMGRRHGTRTRKKKIQREDGREKVVNGVLLSRALWLCAVCAHVEHKKEETAKLQDELMARLAFCVHTRHWV